MVPSARFGVNERYTYGFMMCGPNMAATLVSPADHAMSILKYDIDLAAQIANSGEKVEKFLPLLPLIAIAMAAEGARVGMGGQGSAYTALGKSLGKGIGMLGEVVGIENSWDDIEAGQAWKDLGTFSGDAVYNEPLMGGMLGSKTIEDAGWMDKIGAGLVGAMQGLSFGGLSAAGRGARAASKTGLRNIGKPLREGGEAAMGRGVTSATKDATGEMRRLLSGSRGVKGGTPMTTTGPKAGSRFNPFSSRTEVTSPASAFVSRSGGRFTSQKDVQTALDLLESGNFKTLDEAMEAVRAFKLQGQTGPMTQLGSHGMEHLSRFNPSAIGSGSRRIRVGSALEDAGAVKRPWYRGTPKDDLGKWGMRGRKLDILRRPALAGTQWYNQMYGGPGGESEGEGGVGGTGWENVTDLGGASGDLAQHAGYTSSGFSDALGYSGGGGMGGTTGIGGTSSGYMDPYAMGNVATQSSIGTAHKPIWAGQEWGGKYGTPIATGENMKIGERMLKEAEEKMNEKSGSKKPAHGMVIVIGSKAGPGPSTDGKRDKVDSEKKDD